MVEKTAKIDVISKTYESEFESLMNLIKQGKYEEREELLRIKSHCIALDKLNDVLRRWKQRLNNLDKHMENIDKLDFAATAKKKKVTLHEPCKTAYTGLDQSHRDIIRAMPNIGLREMHLVLAAVVVAASHTIKRIRLI